MITGTFLGGLSYWGLRFIPTGDRPFLKEGGLGFAKKANPLSPKGQPYLSSTGSVGVRPKNWGTSGRGERGDAERPKSPLVCPDSLHLPSKLDGAGKPWTHPVS